MDEDFESQIDPTEEMGDIEPEPAPKPKRTAKNKVTTEVPANIPDEAAEQAKRDAQDFAKREAAEKKEAEKRAKSEEKERTAVEKRVAAERDKMAKRDEENKKINVVREQEHEVLAAIAKASKDIDIRSLMSDCYTEMDAATDMVCKGISYGAIIEGRGGTGKTFRIVNQCNKVCKPENVAYTDSFTTPAAFYIWLYKNRDKAVLIIDDCAGFMNNPKILAFLKGALWHTNDGKTRVVNYMTTKPLKDEYDEMIPSTCEVEARLIIITNYLDDENPHVKAVISRVNHVRVDVPRKELLKILKQIVKQPYKTLDEDARLECLEYLETNTSSKTEDLNIRTLLLIMDFRIWAEQMSKGDQWKVLALKKLQTDDRLALVERLIDEEFESEKEREEAFCDYTGESRSKYYRLHKRIVAQRSQRDSVKEAAKPKAT